MLSISLNRFLLITSGQRCSSENKLAGIKFIFSPIILKKLLKAQGVFFKMKTKNHSPQKSRESPSSQGGSSDGSFNLSAKILYGAEFHGPWMWVSDVKEFISKDSSNLVLLEMKEISFDEYWKRRRKLVGKELSK